MLERTRAAGLSACGSLSCWDTRSRTGKCDHPTCTKFVRPVPRTDLRSRVAALYFIGLVGFFAEYIDSCADRLAPLYTVLEGSKWNKKKPKRKKMSVPHRDARWGEPEKKAFADLRELLSRQEFLVAPSPDDAKNLACDASDYGVGAVLLHGREIARGGDQSRLLQESRMEQRVDTQCRRRNAWRSSSG